MEENLLREMPQVLRARDYRLYTGGGRLVDLWQNGGAAILGHTPPAMFRELKNAAARGLYAPFPHFLEARFTKALTALFPGRTFRIYASPPPVLEGLLQNKTAAFWRPFLDPANPLAVPPPDKAPVLIPLLPGIQGWRKSLPLGLCVLALAPPGPQTQAEILAALPPEDILPPAALALAARGVYSLIAAAPVRAKPAFPRITGALKNSPWRRRGIYLEPRETPPEAAAIWPALFRRFLGAGFLIPPDPDQPLILPGALSPGEEVKLAAQLQKPLLEK